jgi:hypothetical protein
MENLLLEILDNKKPAADSITIDPARPAVKGFVDFVF